MESVSNKTELVDIVEKWNSINKSAIEVKNFYSFGRDISACISFDEITNVKIMTDANEYLVILDESDQENYNLLNIELIDNFKKKKWSDILSLIMKFIDTNNKKPETIFNTNPLNIDHPVQERTKEIIDFNLLRKNDKKIRILSANNNKIPKGLLFESSKIDKMIETEILNINKNFSHLHSIVPIDSIYELSIRIRFLKDKSKSIFDCIEQKYGYNYMEFRLTIDPNMYPFFPPKLEYVRPNISNNIVYVLNNLSILNLSDWNPTISLEWLIVSLADELEPLVEEIVNVENPLNGNDDYSFNPIEYNLIRLAKETGENKSSFLDSTKTISLNYSKISYKKNKKNNKYWKSGVGYGYDGNSNWDIKSYVKEKELQEKNICKILNQIKDKIEDNISEDNRILIENSILPDFIINRFRGTTLIEIEKNLLLYNSILDILSVLVTVYQNFSEKIKIHIGKQLKPLNDEIELLLNKASDINLDPIYFRIHSLSSTFIECLVEVEEVKKEVSSDIKTVYINEMTNLQFNYCDKIESCHYDDLFKKDPPKGSTIKRVLQDVSNLKKNLPLTWGSSVFVRAYKDRVNCLKFIISGPDNTPYENGLFLFHAFFPSTYPEKRAESNFNDNWFWFC